MTDADAASVSGDLDRRNLNALKLALPPLRAVTKFYFRSEVHGMEHVPEGGALLVSNHSGGLIAMDIPIIASAFATQFGEERPLYFLAHSALFLGPLSPLFRAFGFLPAAPESASTALGAGMATLVFPGGDYDAYRPTAAANKIDFKGRTGYVRAAVEAGVPIVPIVSIGGQEALLVLARGVRLARRLGTRRLFGSELLPLTAGFPFGLTLGVPNLPLPTKITTRVLEPVDPADLEDPQDIDEIDRVVRQRMQDAMDELAAARRYPVLG